MPSKQQDLKAVSRFEANLLRILQFLLRRDPAGRAVELIYKEEPAPRCLSRDCVRLVEDTLAKGCLAILARNGWPRERHLRDGQVVPGRLWERHPTEELALSFSENTLRFLIWITAFNPVAKKPTRPVLTPKELTVGDRFFFYLAFGVLRETEGERFFAGKELFAADGLCRLCYPEHFRPDRNLTFAPWVAGTGAVVLEALQPELTQRWLQVERGKAHIGDWQRMQALGRSQERALVSFLDTIDAAGRRDLARFLFAVASALLPDNPRLDWWTGGLRTAGPRLADRSETNQAALVLARIMGRLQEWESQARAVGYFDENYTASQLWKSDWERWHGDLLAARATSLLQQAEPLAG